MHIKVEDALHEACFSLTCDSERRRFFHRLSRAPAGPAPRTRAPPWWSPRSRPPPSPDATRGAAVRTTLTTAAQRRGFLALTLKGRGSPAAVVLLAGRVRRDGGRPQPGVPDRVPRTRRRTRHRLDESPGAGALFTGTGKLKPGLPSCAQRVTARLADRLGERAKPSGPKTVLLVHNSGLLERYFGGARHALLASVLRQAARRKTEALHGLWWLCPMEESKQKPALYGPPSRSWDRAHRGFVTTEQTVP